MALSTKTTSKILHRTNLKWQRDFGDRIDHGEKFLDEVLKLIRSERQVGRLIVDFGVGGGVGSVVFEETESIAQRDLQ